MDLKDLLNETDSFEIDYNGHHTAGVYYKNKITPNYLDELKKLEAEGDNGTEQGYKIIADSIQSWDMTNGGEPYPPTQENLRQVPIGLLVKLGGRLIELQTGNFTNGASSPSGSQQ